MTFRARITRFAVRHLLGRWFFSDDVAKMRRRNGAVRLPRSAAQETLDLGGIPALAVTPEGTGPRALLYLHGGGFVMCSPETHRKLAWAIARAAGARAYLPRYRLAPEHPFPAALEDCVAAYRGLLARGLAPAQIVLGGDSAGGNLALATMLALRQAGLPLPAAAALLSPVTDFTFPLAPEALERELFLDPQFLFEIPAWYVGNQDAADPRVSPALGELRGLPPLILHVGGGELLLDDNRRFAARAREAGVQVELREWPGFWHDFHLFDFLAEARQATSELGGFLRARMDEAAAGTAAARGAV